MAGLTVGGDDYITKPFSLEEVVARLRVILRRAGRTAPAATASRISFADIELDDASKPAYAHNALTVITENGEEIKIVRDNMVFGSVESGDFGTYFIGYAADPAVTETMLENMFIGNPPGTYDRILDFSTAVTGGLFFAPPRSFLDDPTSVPAAG